MQRYYPPVPPEADFVSRMEAVLDRYSRPRYARYPVICMDEHAKLLRADTRPAQPARPGRPATYDYAYVRRGTCTIGMFVEPLGPWRTAHATARRTAVDWAHPVKAIADHPHYRAAERLILSWLHRAEPELSGLTRQALSPRMATQEEVHAQGTAWAEARNAAQKGINWQFRTADARVRLKHPYPSVET